MSVPLCVLGGEIKLPGFTTEDTEQHGELQIPSMAGGRHVLRLGEGREVEPNRADVQIDLSRDVKPDS